MSKYTIGIDFSSGKDETVYCIARRPSWFIRKVNKLLKRGDSWRIVYCGPDASVANRRRYRFAKTIL
jgi:hypothetical protein